MLINTAHQSSNKQNIVLAIGRKTRKEVMNTGKIVRIGDLIMCELPEFGEQNMWLLHFFINNMYLILITNV